MFDLRLENENGNVVNINDGVSYLVLGCSGLTPPSASIFTRKSPNRKGSKYNGSTLDERNIVLQIKLFGDIEANRNALYDWTGSERYCKVYYKNGAKNVYCEGYIQDCEADFFTDNEIINVAILCPDPYFKDLQTISAEITALLKQFTFPFAIQQESVVAVPSKQLYIEYGEGGEIVREYYVDEGVSYVNKGIPFSTIRESNTTTIVNSGEETGVKITLICHGEVENFVLFNAKNTEERFEINTKLSDGWVVTINTDGSPKTCIATKLDGSKDNLLKYVGNNPTWFTLKRGYNEFGFRADSGINDVEVFIGYENKYLGA